MVICMKMCMIRTGWDIRHGAGSSATAGHQNSSALARKMRVLEVVERAGPRARH